MTIEEKLSEYFNEEVQKLSDYSEQVFLWSGTYDLEKGDFNKKPDTDLESIKNAFENCRKYQETGAVLIGLCGFFEENLELSEEDRKYIGEVRRRANDAVGCGKVSYNTLIEYIKPIEKRGLFGLKKK